MADITVYIALGANLGDPVVQVEQALDEIALLPETRLTARSPLYLSKAVGYADQPDFVNAVAAAQTHLSARALLAALLDIETRHGRTRAFKNAPRTLDLDLLLYNGLVMHEPGLTLPHPRMTERAFVLAPLADLAPDALIPGKGRVADCLADLEMRELTRLPDPLARALP